MRVKLTFLEPVLGTWPSNENIARDFIASKAPDASTIEDEIAALGADAVAEKGKTVFPRTDGQPILYDYQIKGFFKDACGMLARVKSKKSSALKAYISTATACLSVSFFLPACGLGNCLACAGRILISAPVFCMSAGR